MHLLLNHIPVLGAAAGLLALLAGLARRRDAVVRVGCALLIVAAAACVPVYLTGRQAEDAGERLPGVAEGTIEAHEEIAGAAFAMIVLTAFAAGAALARSRRTGAVPRGAALAALVLGSMAMVLLARTAHLGGMIRHPEIAPEYAPGSPNFGAR